MTWFPLPPRRVVEPRVRLTRDHGLVHQNVGVWKGGVTRRGEDGKEEFDSCPHGHNKPKTARECGLKEARRRNR